MLRAEVLKYKNLSSADGEKNIACVKHSFDFYMHQVPFRLGLKNT
jgi:hypothetical protein